MKRLHLALAAAMLVAGCASAPLDDRPLQPEAASGLQPKPGWTTRTFAVAAANPLAAEAGHRMLLAGGSAIDAAIAVQMVLTLVEPQSSGIGGGAFLLHFDGQAVEALDGRETAPAATDERLFLDAQGRPLPFHEAVVGGRAVGVPGVLRMLALAHRRHGRLPWPELFQPAIDLAEEGFPLSPRLHDLLTADHDLRQDPVAAAYFYDPQGRPWPVGHRLRNPELAHLLRRIGQEGAQAFYRGEIAQAIMAKVQGHPTRPGRLTLADLARYQPRERAALCHDHQAAGREVRICGFPPPGSGAIAIGQILGLLNLSGAQDLPPVTAPDGQGFAPGADWLHRYTEAARLALADRAQYVADPDFVVPPGGDWASLLAPDYLAGRARLIGAQRMRQARPGTPGHLPAPLAAMPEQVEHGTSHISVVDRYGQALAMTTTIENAFGARQMVSTNPRRAGGFLLNNQLTDFSFAPADAAGHPVANRVQPGKRPRSSMAPTLVFDKASGELLLSGGSPGGALIIHYTAKLLYGVLHWHLSPQQAIDLPNFAASEGPIVLEAGRFGPAALAGLQARGHTVQELPLTSGLQALARGRSHGQPVWLGGADPRREGVVRGN